MQSGELVPLEQLHKKPYAKILCYPKLDVNELKSRIEELKSLGVKTIEFTGEKRAFNVPVLGKGYVGVVVAARRDDRKVALKIRRVDASVARMRREAKMLRLANSVNVGPRFLGVTDNFLLMEFVEGRLIPKWLADLEEKEAESRIRKVLAEVLEQCWRLDQAGLDHGQLSWAPKHIIVNANHHPYIVDFESSSVNRRVSNVTSICQFLFIGSHTANVIKEKLGETRRDVLIDALRVYKRKQTRENFEKILRACKLTT